MDAKLAELIKQGEAIQRRMAAAQTELENAAVVGFAAAGLIQVTVSGVYCRGLSDTYLLKYVQALPDQ